MLIKLKIFGCYKKISLPFLWDAFLCATEKTNHVHHANNYDIIT